jgi:hypothetical protein
VVHFDHAMPAAKAAATTTQAIGKSAMHISTTAGCETCH